MVSRSLLLFVALLASGCGTATTDTRSNPAPRVNGQAMVFVDGLGGRHDVDQHLSEGRTVALAFWQTWCANCRAEGPELVHASKTFRGKVEFFGIVSGSDEFVKPDELQRVTQALGLPYPQIGDRDGAIADRFRVLATPTIIVLGPGGTELYRGARLPVDWARLLGS